MQYAGLLSKASRIGSIVYALVPAERKQHALYRKLTGEAMSWLKYQWTDEDIIAYLTKQYTGKTLPPKEAPKTVLRAAYKRPKQGLFSTINDLLETPSQKVPFRLHFWRCNDRLHRRRYNQSVTSYPWSENVMKLKGTMQSLLSDN
jgi:hypothetical protein